MSEPFAAARDAYRVLASALRTDRELIGDVEQAFALLLNRFDTRIYENRFVVGGVAERIIAAAFVAIGQEASNVGVVVTRTDIRVGAVQLSVKGCFRKARDIRLVNTMGDSTEAQWQEPTIFVLAGSGIGYADPGLLPGQTQRAKDAIQLPLKPLIALWERSPELLVSATIPQSRDNLVGSDVASRIVADDIFRYLNGRRLRPFDTRTPMQ